MSCNVISLPPSPLTMKKGVAGLNMRPGSPLKAYPGSPAVVTLCNSQMPENVSGLLFVGKAESGLALPVGKCKNHVSGRIRGMSRRM